jgi:hypothetical protein
LKAFLYRACAIIFSHFVLYPDYRISFFIPLAFRFADYTKIFLSAGERIFPLQPCQIVPATFGCRKNHPGGRKQAE